MKARRSWLALVVAAAAVIALPAAGAPGAPEPAKGLLEEVSQAVVAHYWAAHPDAAPPQFSSVLAKMEKTPPGRHVSSCGANANKDVYNCDIFGLPQNEESVTACPTNDNLVLGGTNDYRGLIAEFNFTGWHWSIDGGHSVKNEGLLPPVRLISNPNHTVPSGGDPVDFIQAPCNFVYAASLAYDPFDPFGSANGVAVYRSDPSTLSTCDTSVAPSNPACWPTRRLVAESDAAHFLDKEWLFVGGGFVWVTYSDFNYGELEGTDQTFTHKLRIETAPGSATFSPEKVIYAETKAIPFGGFLQGNDFRIATYPKSDVVMVNGHPRIFVIWDACKVRLLGFNCQEALIKLSYSDDESATWAGPIVLSNGGTNYFPTISADRTGTTNNIAAAWYTNAFDNQFENAQDAVATSINPLTGQARGLKRLTSSSSETEADPLLGGFFIGDYFEGALLKNRYYVHTNANYRKVPLLGGFFNAPDQPVIPLNQQDNYLFVTALN